MKKVCGKWVPHFLTGMEWKLFLTDACHVWTARAWMTDVVTGDDSFRSFYGMPSKQANMVGVDEAWDKPVILRPGFQSKNWLLTVFLNHGWTPGGQQSATKESNDQWPLHRNSTAKSCGRPGTVSTHGNHKNCYSMTVLLPAKQRPQFSIWREKYYKSCPIHPMSLM